MRFHLKVSLILFLSLLSPFIKAQVKMARIYDVHPLPHAPNFKAHPLCVYFYMPKQAYQVIETDLQSHNGDTNPTNQKRIHSTLRSDKISLIISRSLQDLEKNYGYSKEKTAELKQLDDSLDP